LIADLYLKTVKKLSKMTSHSRALLMTTRTKKMSGPGMILRGTMKLRLRTRLMAEMRAVPISNS
jgi:hypothetical protein